MGICSSKDKKGMTHPSPLITLDQYGKLASAAQSSRTAMATSHDHHHHHNHLETEHKLPRTVSIDQKPKSRRHRNVKTKKLSNNNNNINNAVEIWLPVVSPCRFKASPIPYALPNSRDLSVDSSHSESDEQNEENEEEISDSPTSNYYKSPCHPFLYSGYLSGSSFSRDLAAALYSRENHIGSFPTPLSNWATSPARRTRRPRPGRNASTVNNAQLHPAGGSRVRRHCRSSAHPRVVHSNMLFSEDHSSGTPMLSRSRSLPKRNKNTRNDNLDVLGHDNDHPLNIHEDRIMSVHEPRLKSINTSSHAGKGKMDTPLHGTEVKDSSVGNNLMNPSDDNSNMDHSHVKSIMNSSDGNDTIKHSSHGKSACGMDSSFGKGNMGSSRRSRELSSQRKLVKGNPHDSESHDQEQKNDVDVDKPMPSSSTKGRSALKDRPVNCPSKWDHDGAKENFKLGVVAAKHRDQKAITKTLKHASANYSTSYKLDGCLAAPKQPSFRNQTNIVVNSNDSTLSSHDECLEKAHVNVVSPSCTDTAMNETLQSNYNIAGAGRSMSNRVQSLISAISKFNTEGRSLSNVEESEADSVIMQTDGGEASKLLKAAARDAFAMPSNVNSYINHSGRKVNYININKIEAAAPDPGLHESTVHNLQTQAASDSDEMMTELDHHIKNRDVFNAAELKSWAAGTSTSCSMLNKMEGATAKWRTNSCLTNSSTMGVLLKTDNNNSTSTSNDIEY